MSGEIEVLIDGERTWKVALNGRTVEGGLSHAAAWKLHDRLSGEAVSPSEKRHDYGWRQYALAK